MKFPWFSLMAMSLLTLTHAHGQIFNVQLNPYTNLNGDAWSTAISPLAYTGTTWTEAGSGSNIADSNDNGSTIGFTVSNTGSSNNGSSPGTVITQSVLLSYQSDLTLTLTGLDDSKTYNLFLVSAYDGSYGGSFTMGSGSAEVSAGNSALTDFVAGQNYVEFANITPVDNQIVVTDAPINNFAMLNGFQLEVVVPEPSTYAMLFGGLGLLVLISRLRRNLSA